MMYRCSVLMVGWVMIICWDYERCATRQTQNNPLDALCGHPSADHVASSGVDDALRVSSGATAGERGSGRAVSIRGGMSINGTCKRFRFNRIRKCCPDLLRLFLICGGLSHLVYNRKSGDSASIHSGAQEEGCGGTSSCHQTSRPGVSGAPGGTAGSLSTSTRLTCKSNKVEQEDG